MTMTPHGGPGGLPSPDPAAAGQGARQVRPAALRWTVLVCASLLCAGFFALGCWQLARLQWKLDLIERVGQRVHAAAVEAPSPANWPRVSAKADEYRHVKLSGVYLHAQTTRVQASTSLGSGFWLLTPLCRADGSMVLVNRGYVPGLALEAAPPAAGPDACADALRTGAGKTVAGLLRVSEPGGGFLRHNDAAGNRWYSRDVAAIGQARGLSRLAPYFVDAEAYADDEMSGPDQPIGGLTVISFANSHLVYAVTWFALALMVAGAGIWVVRGESKRRPGDRV